MKFARRVHSNATLKGGEGRMEIEYLKKKLNYVQVSQLFLSKIVAKAKTINCCIGVTQWTLKLGLTLNIILLLLMKIDVINSSD